MKNVYLSLLNMLFCLAIMSLNSMDSEISLNPVKEEYYKDIPTEYHKIIENNFNEWAKLGDSDRKNCRTRYHMDAITKQQKYNINGRAFRAEFDGYYMISRLQCDGFCSGEFSNGSTLFSLTLTTDYEEAQNKSNCLKQLVQEYKIHLMPKGCMFEDFDALFQLIKNDQELSNQIVTFKLLVFPINDEQIKERLQINQTILPKIVIYPAAGKESAQIVLNKIYAAFKNKEGLVLLLVIIEK